MHERGDDERQGRRTPPDFGSLMTLIRDDGPPNMRCISMWSFSCPTITSTLTALDVKEKRTRQSATVARPQSHGGAQLTLEPIHHLPHKPILPLLSALCSLPPERRLHELPVRVHDQPGACPDPIVLPLLLPRVGHVADERLPQPRSTRLARSGVAVPPQERGQGRGERRWGTGRQGRSERVGGGGEDGGVDERGQGERARWRGGTLPKRRGNDEKSARGD